MSGNEKERKKYIKYFLFSDFMWHIVSQSGTKDRKTKNEDENMLGC